MLFCGCKVMEEVRKNVYMARFYSSIVAAYILHLYRCHYLLEQGLHLAGSQGVIVIAICQVLLMVGPEYARYCGTEALEPLGIFLPGDINYPGGFLFDPLKLSTDPVAFEELKVKEMKNGRLAMVAWLGFYLQAAVTGKGPIQNLVEHVSDPLHNNLLSLFKSV
ncbi:hypothetical protein Cgig2_018082 [Carnegiea gigantea]|uniref:Chlorophyll a-b binding protein, chloroplastic n=1 Tax=Carnegiea gigantea TaxID=171969 RepID=A0A9Q1Q9K6_9CARY|nr:hypothetical protein Cgig2_018082 [Carnegiea gigantea]